MRKKSYEHAFAQNQNQGSKKNVYEKTKEIGYSALLSARNTICSRNFFIYDFYFI